MTNFSEEWLAEYQEKLRGPSPVVPDAVSPMETRIISLALSVPPVAEPHFIAGWPPQAVAQLLTLWREGMSVEQISAAIQKKPRHIVVKVHRLAKRGLIELRAKPFTEEDDKRLLRDYEAAARTGTARELAAEMGRTPQFLSRQARRLGLTINDRARPWSSEACSANVKQWLSENPHPRGMAGKKKTPESIELTRQSSLRAWANPASKFNSKDYRKKLSERMSAAQAAGILRQGYSRGSAGRCPELGPKYFRSSWERNYARYLNFLLEKGEIAKWEYEPDTFWFTAILRGVRSYKPDFKIWGRVDSAPYYVEIKGWMDAKSKTKLKRMKKYHPHIRVDVVEQKQMKALAQTIGPLLPGWERPTGSTFGGRRELLL